MQQTEREQFTSWVLEHIGTHNKSRLILGENTLGRHSTSRLRYKFDFISRHHAVFIVKSNGEVEVKCTGSNGVYINGGELLNGTTKPLAVGDEISIGVTERGIPLGPRDVIFLLKNEPIVEVPDNIIVLSDEESTVTERENQKIHMPQMSEAKVEIVKHMAEKIEDIFGEVNDVILNQVRPINPYLFKELATNNDNADANVNALRAGESIDICSDDEGSSFSNKKKDINSEDVKKNADAEKKQKESYNHGEQTKEDNINKKGNKDDDAISDGMEAAVSIRNDEQQDTQPKNHPEMKHEEFIAINGDEDDDDAEEFLHSQALINDFKQELAIESEEENDFDIFRRPETVQNFASSTADTSNLNQTVYTISDESDEELDVKVSDWSSKLFSQKVTGHSQIYQPSSFDEPDDANEEKVLNHINNMNVEGICAIIDAVFKSEDDNAEGFAIGYDDQAQDEDTDTEPTNACETVLKEPSLLQPQASSEEEVFRAPSPTSSKDRSCQRSSSSSTESIRTKEKVKSESYGKSAESTKSGKKKRSKSSDKKKSETRRRSSSKSSEKDNVTGVKVVTEQATEKAEKSPKTPRKRCNSEQSITPEAAGTKSSTPTSSIKLRKRAQTICADSLQEHLATSYKGKAKPSSPKAPTFKEATVADDDSISSESEKEFEPSTRFEKNNSTPRRIEVIKAPKLPLHRGKLRAVSADGSSAALKRMSKKPESKRKVKDSRRDDIRKDRLRKVAEAQKELAASSTSGVRALKRKHSSNKTKAVGTKITEINRGAFLAEEVIQPPPAKKEFKIPKMVAKAPSGGKEEKECPTDTFSQQIQAADRVRLQRSMSARMPPVRRDALTARAVRTTNKITFASMEKSLEHKEQSEKKLNELINHQIVPVKKLKKVHFAEKPIIHYIEAVPTAIRRVCSKVKDFAGISTGSYATRRAKARQTYELVDHTCQIIKDILAWSNEWLLSGCADQAAANDVVLPLANEFRSYEHYKSVILPLMKLEFQSILQRECCDKWTPFTVCLDDVIKNNDRFILITRYPNATNCRFDLVTLNFGSEHKPIFAYLQAMRKGCGTTCTLVYEILADKLDRDFLKSFSKIYVKPYIDNVRVDIGALNAVHQLQYTPLFKQIIDPRTMLSDDPPPLKLPKYKGFTPLNHEQKNALLSTYIKVIDEQTPNITLLQGPPGTGKSIIIVNLILQCLYGLEVRCRDRKILVCSQSNTAINNIAMRLKCIADSMRTGKFRVIRFGCFDKMCSRSKQVSLQYFIEEARKTRFEQHKMSENELNRKYQEEQLANEIKVLSSLGSRNATTDAQLLEKEKQLKRLNDISKRIFTPEDERAMSVGLLDRANVVCTTLSSCVKLAQYSDYFDICIIDEATQCTEPWTLLPFKFHMPSLVLVGDTQQLPATVISKKASDSGLSKSMFARIQNCLELEVLKDAKLNAAKGTIIQKLQTQYRMHPEICKWPNEYFYDNLLKYAEHTRHYRTPLLPYCIFNLKYTSGDNGTHGKITNKLEAQFVARLVKALDAYIPLANNMYGIITPYLQHCDMLWQALTSESLISPNVKINTIDSIQGLQRDVIIISNARTQGVGFLANPQRLNVALTRAKKCLILCGNFGDLECERVWRHLLENARKREVFFELNDNVIDDMQTKVISKILLPQHKEVAKV